MDSSHAIMEALSFLKPNLGFLNDELKIEEIWKTNEMHTTNTVRELLAAYEQQDFVLLGDVLEYELFNSFGKWIDALRTVMDKLDSGGDLETV